MFWLTVVGRGLSFVGLVVKNFHGQLNIIETDKESYITYVERDSASNQTKLEYKIFNDPIHGTIKLHPLLVDIINTPQFQRLKDIKQLGICDYVYPGATHTRFEHSLGTSYLCGKLIDKLQELHRGEIEITDKECMCIKIAGLCHDLGHGPFSHFFEEEYIKKQKPDWQHEDLSCDLFDFMLKENSKLRQSFEDFRLGEEDIEFIKELIKGKNPNDVTRICKKKNQPKCFLYEIVSNKRNGIDCDKFDYFARDCANVGVKSNFDHRRYFENVRIMSNPDNQQLQICVRDKEVFNLYELFHTRWSLHHRVYKHKTLAPIEDLLFQAFKKVDEVMKISDAVEKAVQYEEYEDMRQYCVLTDSILHDILRNETPVFKKAQDLIKRIQNRKIYKFCGQSRQESKGKSSSPELNDDEIRTKIAEDLAQNSKGELKKEDIFVSSVKINFGMKNKNPIDAVMFFNKSLEVIRIKREQVSGMLPRDFEDKYFRVYARNPDQKELIRRLFKEWCSGQKNFQEPFGG
ncbi:deoxynucleoside triphosphate triphosphohydrolase SAMHD1-like [Xenia sp. Carnegie-2017]|uniref:deoxynucleoside triphosphate triphosphohydrolase SAMHD1-like n=1 Tax=Xenia sp. Carnegie-2017 TaxID=2897299 RepID=UPI001F04BDC9|nr:deoxynucleoside triphosphate triphosphohydrolase SAMHD1-like [Xenia sp. Carnegie-2017]XP_046843282.1 deoxynucleoside triphosphate triphosphohydrolase SAMHD1-like [Xenia sp. Carnegie-2017]